MGYFKYSKEVEVTEVNPVSGEPIKILGEDGITPTGKFSKVKVTVQDYFNLNKVIRTHAVSPTQVIVLLDDGHEVTEKVPTLKNKNHDPKKPVRPSDIVEEKQRIWVQSEISITDPDDIEALYKALEFAV